MTDGSQTTLLPAPAPTLTVAEAPQPSRSPALPCPRLLAALVSAGLLWLCYFPLAWGWLAWIALVPLLSLVRAEMSAKRLFVFAWLAGLAFFWPVLQWMRVADDRMYYCWGLLATYCSLYFPAGLLLIRRLDRGAGLPLALTVPVVWTALEFLRSFLLTGFAWYYLGHTQHAFVPIVQIADLGGAYAVTFLVATVNAWLFELLFSWKAFRNWLRLGEPVAGTGKGARLVCQSALVATLVVAALVYGFWRAGQEDFLPGPRVALLQGNLDQRFRNKAFASAEGDPKRHIFDYYRALGWHTNHYVPRPDLLVWPETSFPYFWLEMPAKLDQIAAIKKEYQFNLGEMVRALARQELQTNFLLGLNYNIVDETDHETQYNSALLILGTGGLGGRYDKIHRVPFGEYVPFKDEIAFLNRLAPYDFDYSIKAGKQLTRLVLPGSAQYRFGVLICFEDTDPYLARQYGRATSDGPAVDFLINISNDGWFDGSSEHEEHLAISRFRAVECRRPLLRAVNMGVSAVIDSNGRVQLPQLAKKIDEVHHWQVEEVHNRVPELPHPQWRDYKKVMGILTASVPLDSRVSLYVRWGDWLPWSCCAIVGCGFMRTFRNRRR